MASETPWDARRLVRRFGSVGDRFDQFSLIERIRDGEFTRKIRSSQFYFAMWVLTAISLALGTIIGIDLWRMYSEIELPACDAAQCDVAHRTGALLDWARALINTLFGAALALALGSVYSPPERRG